jgi:hypothetical protein
MLITSAVGRSALALIAACVLCADAVAQSWPDKPVKLIVNFPPGGVADTLARAISPGVSEAIKQPVVVENRPGANGAIGAERIASFSAEPATIPGVNEQTEVGISFGTRPKLAWWKVSMPKLGLSYRFGDGISAVRYPELDLVAGPAARPMEAATEPTAEPSAG